MSLYTFFPASPTQYAWDNRTFKEKVALKEIPPALKARRPYLGGFVVTAWPPNRTLFPRGQYHVFGG